MFALSPTLTLEEEAALFAALGVWSTIMVIALVAALFGVICMWRIFTKAGEEGWTAIVPFYNMYVLSKISTGNGLLFFITLIPFVGGVFALYLQWRLGQSFGKSVGFCVGLCLLPVIFLAILAFGDSRYHGPFYNPELGYSVPPQGSVF